MVARPALFVATVAGAGVFIVSLPLSILGGNVKQAGYKLVANPARSTFLRCLGCADKTPS